MEPQPDPARSQTIDEMIAVAGWIILALAVLAYGYAEFYFAQAPSRVEIGTAAYMTTLYVRAGALAMLGLLFIAVANSMPPLRASRAVLAIEGHWRRMTEKQP